MQIRECKSDDEIMTTYRVVEQLYEFTSEQFLSYIKEMTTTEYRLIGVYNEGDQCVAAVGFRVGRRLYCGRYLHIDNMIVDHKHRNQGLASEMLGWLREEAMRLECDVLLADTYVENTPAQDFFYKEGFQKRGHHLKASV